MIRTVRNFLSDNITTLLVMVIVSLGVTTKWAIDVKKEAQADLIRAQVTILQNEADLAHERAKQASLTLALTAAEERSQAILGANERLSTEVSNELQANPDWSRTAVPAGVAERLCEQFVCAPAESRGESP